MALLSKTVAVRWNGKTRKHYEELGYIWGGQNNWFEVEIDHLLTTSPVRVKVQCDYCGKLYEKAYREIFRRNTVDKIACFDCSYIKGEEVVKVKYGVDHHTKIEGVRESITVKQKLSTNELLNIEKQKNISFIDVNLYINNFSEIEYICNEHQDIGIQVGSITSIKKSEYCCKHSSTKHGKLRNDLEYVETVYESKNLTLLNLNEYTNKETKMDYYCNKHPQFIQSNTLDSVKNTKTPCCHCRIEESLHDLSTRMRWVLSDWKNQTEIECDYKCVITGNTTYDIHHLVSLSTIIKKVLSDLNITDYFNISTDKMLLIKKEVKERHKSIKGVCLDRKLHQLFHKTYGYYNNTPEQFYQFKNKYIKGEFRDVV